MGVAVLSPQDCLSPHPHHRHLISPATKARRNPNPNPNANPNRSSRRRRNSPPPPSSASGFVPSNPLPRAKSPPVKGQIRILKRGEDISLAMEPTEPEVLSRPEPEPQPAPTPAQIPDGFYAGSAFVTSPPPSSLPLPAFFTKRNCGLGEAHNQEIASQLRRVLKLN